MKLFLILLLLQPLSGFSQKASFKIIKVPTNIHGNIYYPVVILTDKKIENKINRQIRQKLLGELSRSTLIRQLKEWSEGIYMLKHEVTLNRNYILSFKAFTEGCGAYCSSRYDYFNFDLRRGNAIAWTDLIEPKKLPEFKKDLDSLIKSYRTKYIAIDLKEQAEGDSALYEEVKSELESCPAGVLDDHFSLFPNKIEFITDCQLRHVIQSFEPDNLFVYDRNKLKPWLIKKYSFLLQ